ncbi:MAG: hypothetical protein ACI8Q3_002774, partial [Marinomonas primoryensis]
TLAAHRQSSVVLTLSMPFFDYSFLLLVIIS